MQTFLPFADYIKSAESLDRQRLGKQRVEVKQLLRALRGESKGWTNHPAAKMWAGYEKQLAVYGVAVCVAWRARGYKDSLLPYFEELTAQYPDILPTWLGDTAFHRSHQSNLVRKDPVFYGAKFPGVPDNLPYVWPTGL